MEIKVNEQAQRFYLACDKWEPAIGHGIKVGEYHFFVAPIGGKFNVSEATTGIKVFEIPINVQNFLETKTKQGTMDFLKKVGEKLKRIIEKHPEFDEKLEEGRQMMIERIGEMPEIENVDLKEMAE